VGRQNRLVSEMELPLLLFKLAKPKHQANSPNGWDSWFAFLQRVADSIHHYQAMLNVTYET
jgi:hypothetical protein